MPHVDLTLPHHRYAIHIEPGLLADLGPRVRAAAAHDRAALLVDGSITDTYGPVAAQSLRNVGYDVLVIPMPVGESHKNLKTTASVYEQLVTARLERRSPVIALGGGVVGDTAGFVAATYLRGVPFVQCPTTLLAMVDASVGGKVGVNLPQGKNLVGAFYQPVVVAIDTDTLASLPPRELRCGLAECVKHAVIRDAALFDWLERHIEAILGLDRGVLVELVQRNVQIKATVVMADEKETGQRAHLNFGHTFAHAIESTQGYGGYHHGEAVSLGMVAASRLAAALGLCDVHMSHRLTNLLDRIGLPVEAAELAPTRHLLAAMRVDKKVANNRIRLVLPLRIGEVTIRDDVEDDAVAAAWDSLRMKDA